MMVGEISAEVTCEGQILGRSVDCTRLQWSYKYAIEAPCRKTSTCSVESRQGMFGFFSGLLPFRLPAIASRLNGPGGEERQGISW
jgi:hypothetical protein